MEYIEQVKSLIKKHEGFRSKPYVCTAGKQTIGYGRNLEDNGISEGEADLMLENDLQWMREALDDVLPVWANFDATRQAALASMMFNLGAPRFGKFENMLEALRAGDFTLAAEEALDSRWASQVGHRAQEIADMIRTGDIGEV